MTRKTRYFVLGAAAVLIVGLGGGLVAYLYTRGAVLPDGVPAEVRYVPANVDLIAFVDIRAVMNSELRKQLMPTLEGRSSKAQRMMTDVAGIDLEKQVHRVLIYAEPSDPAEAQGDPNHDLPRAAVLVNGTFDLPRIEQSVRERAGELTEYNGRKLLVHGEGAKAVAVGFVATDLIVLGRDDAVRRVIDLSAAAPRGASSITGNHEMMRLIRDAAGSTAWVIGHFDALRRRMKVPAEVSSKVPPLRLISAKAHVNGGVRATVRAEATDDAAAQQLRDAVRGFVSLARLHSGGKPEFDDALKSIELSGTEKTVQLSFAMSPETLRRIAPPPPAPPPPPSQP